MVEFHQILRLFKTETNRPKAWPAIFKHVGPIKILVHFGRQDRYGRIPSNFMSFQHRA